ncbi:MULTISPECIES: hypothetical protein [Achromobacter]|uniref:Polysaccharide chain length determinant N-terminal domain-containing protein n=1 Tax=Achromobacter denitrificans TaxID=32002 RepID=A0A6N0JVB4_ACHDE|nr:MULTISPECIES: hypothetical protein [Achromobacter]QKQ50566.1 hypothetical protein FOC81_29175 [Achromobacter denitrificans]
MSDSPSSYSNPEDSRFLQDILISHWLLIILGALGGLVVAVAIAMSQPKVWPAMALAKIGQVGGTNALTDPAAVLARTQFPSFVQDALRAAGMPVDVDSDVRAKLAKKTFNTQVQKGPSLFQMQVDGLTKEDATKFLTGALAVLQREHQALLDVAVKEKKERLASLETSIEGNQKEHQTILDSIKANAAKIGQQAPDPIMVSYLLRANEVERSRFVEQQTNLRDQLQEAKTHNTRFEAPVFVAQTPQGPSRIVAALVGALLGSALMVIIFALWAWLAPKRN